MSISPFVRESFSLTTQKHEAEESDNVKITLYMNTRYTYSAVLTSVINNFSSFYQHKLLGELLPYEVFLLAFKADDLDVISEDHVFEAFTLWAEHAQDNPDVHEVMVNDQLRKLCDQIRWRYVSLTKLMKYLNNSENFTHQPQTSFSMERSTSIG